MDTKFRLLYLFVAGAGLVYLFYFVIATFPDVDLARVLLITIPDMLFFFLAYRTYPETSRVVIKPHMAMQEHIAALQKRSVKVNR